MNFIRQRYYLVVIFFLLFVTELKSGLLDSIDFLHKDRPGAIWYILNGSGLDIDSDFRRDFIFRAGKRVKVEGKYYEKVNSVVAKINDFFCDRRIKLLQRNYDKFKKNSKGDYYKFKRNLRGFIWNLKYNLERKYNDTEVVGIITYTEFGKSLAGLISQWIKDRTLDRINFVNKKTGEEFTYRNTDEYGRVRRFTSGGAINTYDFDRLKFIHVHIEGVQDALSSSLDSYTVNVNEKLENDGVFHSVTVGKGNLNTIVGDVGLPSKPASHCFPMSDVYIHSGLKIYSEETLIQTAIEYILKKSENSNSEVVVKDTDIDVLDYVKEAGKKSQWWVITGKNEGYDQKFRLSLEKTLDDGSIIQEDGEFCEKIRDYAFIVNDFYRKRQVWLREKNYDRYAEEVYGNYGKYIRAMKSFAWGMKYYIQKDPSLKFIGFITHTIFGRNLVGLFSHWLKDRTLNSINFTKRKTGENFTHLNVKSWGGVRNFTYGSVNNLDVSGVKLYHVHLENMQGASSSSLDEYDIKIDPDYIESIVLNSKTIESVISYEGLPSKVLNMYFPIWFNYLSGPLKEQYDEVLLKAASEYLLKKAELIV